jgi:hypothetical protein
MWSSGVEGDGSEFFVAGAVQNDKLNAPVNISWPGHLNWFWFLEGVWGWLKLARAELVDAMNGEGI